MTEILAGQVLRPAARASRQGWAYLILAIALPLFGGVFQYVIETPAPYALSKTWPFLMLPLTAWAVIRPGPPYKVLLLAACAWLIGVAPLVSMAGLGAGLTGAMTATVKVWPLTGALAGFVLLAWLRPSPATLAGVIAWLGLVTYALMAGLWLLLPEAAFLGTLETAKVLLTDPERGRRVNMPMLFGLLGLFLLNRSLWRSPALWKLAALAACLALMFTVYKQRAPIAGTLLVLPLGAALSAGRWRWAALVGLAAAALALLVPVLGYLGSEALAESLGGSLSARRIEAEAALAHLNAQPWRWLIGAGGATRLGEVSWGDILGVDFFYPSDLGWLGVVFEYGAVGAGLMLALHLAALRLAWRAARAEAVLGGALFDYAVYLLAVSPIVCVVLNPGELALVLALCAHLVRTHPGRPAGRGSGP